MPGKVGETNTTTKIIQIPVLKELLCCKEAVPNLSGSRDRSHGRQFFHRTGCGDGQAVTRATGSR